MMKVDAELKEAVKKHGKVSIPTTHIEDFYEKIYQKKADIVSTAA